MDSYPHRAPAVALLLGIVAVASGVTCSTPRPYSGNAASGAGGISGAVGGAGAIGTTNVAPTGGMSGTGGVGPAGGAGDSGSAGSAGGSEHMDGSVTGSGGVPGAGGHGANPGGGSPGSGSGGTNGGAGGRSSFCAADEKQCGGICVKVSDPSYGCAASGCNPCILSHVAQATCSNAVCGIGNCSPGFMNCDTQPDCETDITTPSHCGGCTTTCLGDSPSCVASGATYMCETGCTGVQVRCSGLCTDLNVDLLNCGACGKACAVANGIAHCVGGSCAPASCDAGYSKCGPACEYTDGDANNCGGCNLKCPGGSLCKGGLCEVRVGYPSRFTANENNPFTEAGGGITAFPFALSKQSTLVAFGYINESTVVGAVASFGLYSDSNNRPGTLVASAVDVVLKSSVQEVGTQNLVLQPGTYYFAVLSRDGEPQLYTSPNLQVDWWVSMPGYEGGLPVTYDSVAPEVFRLATPNVYIVVRQAGG